MFSIREMCIFAFEIDANILFNFSSHPSCSTISDEISRLWRLAVLKPGVPPKQCEGVIDQLRTFNQTGSL